MTEMHELKYYDKEIWTLMSESVGKQGKIQNVYFFENFHQIMSKLNTDPSSPLFELMTADIEAFVKKHYNKNRAWRYNLEEARMRTYQELVANRDNCNEADFTIQLKPADNAFIEAEKKAQQKMQRMKLAKYDKDLLEQVLKEMMKEGRTLMEMMAELDITDEKMIIDAQERLSKKE
jgi:hypothetical protein